MKITVYTITDCQFSKQELEYLKAHNLQYEEKNLELHREFLSEMLNISNNFAGTPVTKIEKDDGKIVVLKGFTAEEFDEALGFKKDEKKEEAKPAQPGQPEQAQKPEPAKPTNTAAPAPAGTAANIQPTAQPGTPPAPVAPAPPDAAAPKVEIVDPNASLSSPPVMPDLGPSMTTAQGISLDPSMPATPSPMPTIELPPLNAAPAPAGIVPSIQPTAQAAADPVSDTSDADLDAILKDLEMKASGTEAAPVTPAPATPAQPVASVQPAAAAPTTPAATT